MAIRTRRNRRQTKGRFKLHKYPWVDPFPQIEGTEPEKRVFAALVQRGIYFIYQGQIPEFEIGGKMYYAAPPNYKPDFILPEYKLIIDPFSPFHHSLKGADERDRDKIARYAVAGYAYYHPWALGPGLWSFDQLHNETGTFGKGRNRIRLHQGVNAKLNSYRKVNRAVKSVPLLGTAEMLARIPELTMGGRYPLIDPRDKEAKKTPGYRIGQYLGAGANSVGAANSKRRKPPVLGFSTGTRRTIRRSR